MNKPTLEDKKNFLSWFIQNYQLKRRESLWILNYLLNHEVLLKNIHLVEQIEKTDRGIGLAAIGHSHDSFVYYKEGKRFDDPEQAFHDLRLNWKEEFYLELFFEQAYQTMSYFGVLEDNPFVKEELFDKEAEKRVEASLERLGWQERKKYLMENIDLALKEQDVNKFHQYTKELKEIDEKNLI